ncbi:MAG: hypothetical protein KJ630_20765, partial [Proteobacteria bacterium]|nr:hypothetical protein [Pseudomonadota bacterium]
VMPAATIIENTEFLRFDILFSSWVVTTFCSVDHARWQGTFHSRPAIADIGILNDPVFWSKYRR